eukprot:COSAG02_NODE_64755_length_259_cov_1.387500_1_plen_41_part_10
MRLLGVPVAGSYFCRCRVGPWERGGSGALPWGGPEMACAVA